MSRGYVLPVRATQAHGGIELQFQSILLLTLASKVWSNTLLYRFTVSDKAADTL